MVAATGPADNPLERLVSCSSTMPTGNGPKYLTKIILWPGQLSFSFSQFYSASPGAVRLRPRESPGRPTKPMSADQLKQAGNNQTARETFPVNLPLPDPPDGEPDLVNLYRQITQENESQARNVLMFVVPDEEERSPRPPN